MEAGKTQISESPFVSPNPSGAIQNKFKAVLNWYNLFHCLLLNKKRLFYGVIDETL
ncbi:hypothetical protein YC2023_107688 [Brassica napus]